MVKSRNFSKNVPAGTSVILGSIDVPSQCSISLMSGENFCNNTAAWGFLVWRIRRNGIAVFPHDEIMDPRFLSGGNEPVVFRGGDVLDVLAENHFSVDVEMRMILVYDQQ
jgi:hypothetical protein